MTSRDTARVRYLAPIPSAATALAALSDPVRAWFTATWGEPTAAQRLAWPAAASGDNLLLCAPTGGGKTLAAFLPLLDHLLHHSFASGIRCLYVAPLKALGNDARKNLRRSLRGLRAHFPEGSPRPRVALRTGDTPARLRQALLLQPPDVLLTTPESLAILLTQRAVADRFASVRWVVVDEVHSLAGTKRGADLALSLERLDALAGGGVRRLGLSATCAPLAEAARYLAGSGRTCAVAQVGEAAGLDLAVEPLPAAGAFLQRLVARLEPELLAHRTTLIFTNTRKLAERLAWALRRHHPEWDDRIAVHHSALAAARRRLVERALKQGRLRAAVTSTSLELGIDIGTVDRVVLVHPPGGVVRLLQRVGRAGHAPGGCRRGLVLTAGPAELLEATVTAASSRSAQCEPLRLPSAPLDVLCQHLLGLSVLAPWAPDAAFDLVRRAAPYEGLSRADFDGCLAYLSGRRGDGTDWLPPRLAWSGGQFRIRDARTARLLRRNLGTLLTDDARPVRYVDGPVVGEVEERFADRLNPGDRFLLDGRCLEYRRLEGGNILVEEVTGRPVVPTWTGEGLPLSPELARRLYVLRQQAAEALRDGPEALAELFHRDYGVQEAAVRDLVEFFQRQEGQSEIPDGTTCLIEQVPFPGVWTSYVHTPLNRAGNDALARVAVARLARDFGRAATSLVADLGFSLLTRGDIPLSVEGWRGLLAAARWEEDLDETLADSVAVRERFRRTATVGLMTLRNPLGKRRRVGGQDWADRRLFEQVRSADPGFVLLRQAEREVRETGCDVPAARAYVALLESRTFRCRTLGQISPFVEGWTQLAAGPSEAVETPAEALRRLHAELTGAPGFP